MALKHIKVVVLDLDGTLYDDMHHFDFYAGRLRERLPAEKRQSFDRDYIACKNGRHPLKVGRVYDAINDLILTEMDKVVQDAYTWSGERLSRKKTAELYRRPIEYDFVNMISVGDPWWIPAGIAGHYGISREKIYEAYLETREYMNSPQFQMKKIPGLKEAINKLRKRAETVLLTNSSREDSETILEKLELCGLFSLKIFNGKKPAETKKWFQHIRDRFQVSFEEMMSVGDNWVNEIRPVKALGCMTAYIDAYGTGETRYADFAVSHMTELLPVLERIGHP